MRLPGADRIYNYAAEHTRAHTVSGEHFGNEDYHSDA